MFNKNKKNKKDNPNLDDFVYYDYETATIPENTIQACMEDRTREDDELPVIWYGIKINIMFSNYHFNDITVFQMGDGCFASKKACERRQAHYKIVKDMALAIYENVKSINADIKFEERYIKEFFEYREEREYE